MITSLWQYYRANKFLSLYKKFETYEDSTSNDYKKCRARLAKLISFMNKTAKELDVSYVSYGYLSGADTTPSMSQSVFASILHDDGYVALSSERKEDVINQVVGASWDKLIGDFASIFNPLKWPQLIGWLLKKMWQGFISGFSKG